jgi:hypothetical protein
MLKYYVDNYIILNSIFAILTFIDTYRYICSPNYEDKNYNENIAEGISQNTYIYVFYVLCIYTPLYEELLLSLLDNINPLYVSLLFGGIHFQSYKDFRNFNMYTKALYLTIIKFIQLSYCNTIYMRVLTHAINNFIAYIALYTDIYLRK